MDFETFVIQLCVMSGKDGNKPEIDNTSKCLLPQFVFQELMRRQTPYPICFELFFPHNGKTTHLGVVEFTASEGTAVIPQWVMNKFHARKLAHVQFRTVALPLGNYLRVRPMKAAFVELANPKLVLEHHLTKNTTALTVGDVIHINYLDQVFEIQVVEVRTRQYGKTQVIRTAQENMNNVAEMILEFDRAADLPDSPIRSHSAQFPTVAEARQGIDFEATQQAPSKFAASVAPGISTNSKPVFSDGHKFTAFGGSGRTMAGGNASSSTTSKALGSSEAAKAKVEADSAKPTAPSVGRTLSGKSVALPTSSSSSSAAAVAPGATAGGAATKEDAAPSSTTTESTFSGHGRTLGGGRRPPPPGMTTGGAGGASSSTEAQDAASAHRHVGRTLRGEVVVDSDNSTPASPAMPPSSSTPSSQLQPPGTGNNAPSGDDDKGFHPFQGGGRKLT